MVWTSLGPYKVVLDMGSSSLRGLIIVPGQEANGDNLGMSTIFYKMMVFEAILMSTHNIYFHDKIRKFL